MRVVILLSFAIGVAWSLIVGLRKGRIRLRRLLPRPETMEHLPRLRERGAVDLGTAAVERRGNATFVTMRNPRFLNAEDETTSAATEIAVDLAILDSASDIAVLRGDFVEHAKYRGRRIFSAGINLTHLYHGKISLVWYIQRNLGFVNKLFRGSFQARSRTRRRRRGPGHLCQIKFSLTQIIASFG
jgi:DNA-binding transcriptional ArsR family regulator